jgi:hypothetical protein
MSEKVVLPKFNLPGHTPHPAVRALWGAGALLVIATLGLGGVMWRHHSLEVAAEQRREAEAKAAEAKAAQAAAEAKAEEAKAKAAAVAAAAEAKAAALAQKQAAAAPLAANSDKPASAGKPASSRGLRGTYKHHGAKSSKARTLAKSSGASATAKGPKKPSGRRDDVIDKLLTQFK